MNAPTELPVLEPARERVLLLFLIAVQFASIVDFMILMPLGPRLMEGFQITPGQFGALVSAYTFSAGVFGLLAAPLLDRFTRKTAMLWSFAGFMLGTFYCGYADSYHALLAARIIAGCFGGLTGSMIMATLADAIPLHRRAAAMGWVMTSFALASVAGVPLGISFANHWGWHAPFRILGALSALVLAASVFGLPVLSRPSGPKETAWQSLREIFARPRHWLAFAFTALLMVAGFSVIPYISATLVQNGGLTNEQLPYIYFTGGFCTLFSAPLIGKLADKIGLFKIFAVMSLLTLVPMLFITHLGRTSLAHAMVLTTLFMVCASGRFTPAFTLVTSAVESRHRGGFLSVNTACQQIFTGLAAMTSALILTAAPGGRIAGYGTVGWISAAALLLSVAVGSRIRREEPAT